MENTLFPQPSEPLPPPQPAPDYLATIQAPIPTPEPDQTVPATTTSIHQTDRQRLTDWMVSSAWMSAASAFSRASPERLLSLTAVSQERNPCYQQLAGGVHLLATGGKLLAPTGDITQQAVDCLDRAAGRNPQADNYLAQSLPDRAQLLAELLQHHSIAGNPYTQQAAAPRRRKTSANGARSGRTSSIAATALPGGPPKSPPYRPRTKLSPASGNSSTK